ncbi:MAG: dihydrofolate reductase [Pseudomonadota bacterium]
MSVSPEIVFVLARARNGVIGRDGDLPWRLPADLKHFKALTQGAPMLMGRKTFESLPGLLPGRRHIVLTRDYGWHAEGAEVVHSVDDAIAATQGDRLSVVGGAEIYALLLPHADRIELTEVDDAPDGDTLVPAFDPAIWREEAREEHPAVADKPAFAFVTLRRR